MRTTISTYGWHLRFSDEELILYTCLAKFAFFCGLNYFYLAFIKWNHTILFWIISLVDAKALSTKKQHQAFKIGCNNHSLTLPLYPVKIISLQKISSKYFLRLFIIINKISKEIKSDIIRTQTTKCQLLRMRSSPSKLIRPYAALISLIATWAPG